MSQNYPSFGIAVVCAVFLSLSGCTGILWANHPVTGTESVDVDIGRDQIRAFGVVRDANSQLGIGSLVMMGDRYWYVLNPESSKEAAAVLNGGVGLAKPYTIGKSGNNRENELAVRIKENQKFDSSFCLNYAAEKPQEAAKLESLGFKKDYGRPYYSRCFGHVSGMFYTTPPQAKRDYRFQTPVPVKLTARETKNHFNAANLVGNILVTPITLAADTVLGIIALPMIIFGK